MFGLYKVDTIPLPIGSFVTGNDHYYGLGANLVHWPTRLTYPDFVRLNSPIVLMSREFACSARVHIFMR